MKGHSTAYCWHKGKGKGKDGGKSQNQSGGNKEDGKGNNGKGPPAGVVFHGACRFCGE